MPQAWAYLLVSLSLLVQIHAFTVVGAPAQHDELKLSVSSSARNNHDHPVHPSSRVLHQRQGAALCMAAAGGDGEKEEPGLSVKAAWYGSELFGNIIGFGKNKESAQPASKESGSESSAPISRTDAVARLKTDFDRFYFVTGQMDLDLYEPECVFADPFVSFEGRDRFKNNLDNLGSLMQDVSLDVTKWEETEESIKTKWRFRCVLGLPWKPTLAAAGGTEFFFNGDSGRINRHVESWEIEPIDALKQLIRPGRKKPSRS